MDANTRQAVEDAVKAAVDAQDTANNLIKRVLVDEVRSAYPTAIFIELSLEEDGGARWYFVSAIRDIEGVAIPDDEEADEIIQEIAGELFVTDSFGTIWITLDTREKIES